MSPQRARTKTKITFSLGMTPVLMTCTLLSFSSPNNLEKRRRRDVEYRLLQFAVHLEYRAQELSQKLRQ